LSEIQSFVNGQRGRRDTAFFCMAAAYLLLWIVAAIAPHDRFGWLLENMLVLAALPVVWRVYAGPGLTHGAWALVFAFLALHAYGAHYTYSNTPLGFWLRDGLGLERNHYDRIVHLSFGLLITLPVRDLLRHGLGIARGASGLLAATAMLSMSALYEIIEWLAARVVDPALGVAFVGAQGDAWDAQKDMGLALLGIGMALLASTARERLRGAPSYTAGDDSEEPADRQPR